MARRKAISLTPDEDRLLRTLHRQTGVPDGQFPQRQRFWSRFTRTWNQATGRHDTPEEVLHYITTQRKQAKWFQFGKDHKRLKTPEPDLLTDDQWKELDRIYEELNVASDNYLFDRDLRAEIVRRFVASTGEHVPELVLVAAMVARRKSGKLPCLEPGGADDIGFGDLDEVG